MSSATQAAQAPEHEVAHAGVNQGLARLDLVFVVFAQPAQPTPTTERPPPIQRCGWTAKVLRGCVLQRLTTSSPAARAFAHAWAAERLPPTEAGVSDVSRHLRSA